jgi:hypothetical protein
MGDASVAKLTQLAGGYLRVLVDCGMTPFNMVNIS